MPLDPRAAHRYRFGPFEADLATGELWNDGRRVKVQSQPLQVLAVLLAHPGEMVGREELQRRLWPADTFVDFDLGLNVAIKKLRDALGDSAENPRYIETLARRGYRFIAVVEAQAASEAALLPPAQGDRGGGQTAPPLSRRWGGWVAIAAGLLLVALATWLGGWRWTQPHAKVEFSQRDWVLISQFENRTGNPSLDGSLETLLEREISNSHYVNVVPPERIHDTMRLMRLPMEGRPPLAVAREVAVRDGGIKAVVTGKAERIGGRYVIGASVVLPADGVTVSSYTEEAGSEEQIVPAMRRLSDRLRERLGEDLADIQRSGESLEKVTTPSLQALRLFSQSMPYMLKQDWATAARLLEEALRDDPSFVTAHLHLARCYANLDNPKSAAPHWEEALRLSSQATESERLFIVGSYYYRYRVDLKKAIQAYETLVNLYPNNYWAINNLADIYETLPQEDDPDPKLAVYFGRAADLRPTDFMTNYQAWEYCDPTPASSVYRERALRALRALTLEDRERLSGPVSVLQLEPVMAEVQAGDLAAAVKDLEVAEKRAPEMLPLSATEYAFTVFRLETAMGRNAAAEKWMHRLPPSDERYIQLNYLAWLRNDKRAQAALLRSISDKEWVYVYFVARSGHVQEAERLAPEVQQVVQKSTGGLRDRREGLARGEISLQRGDLSAAARQCDETLSGTKQRNFGTYWLAADCEVTALERQHDLAGAARVLEGVASPEPGFSPRQFWIMSEANRVRLYRQLGRNPEAARIAYRLEELLAVADPNHPARALLASGSKPSQNKVRAAALATASH